MSSLFHDIRFAFRVIRKNPVTSTVIVATLALGIGGNTAMFAGFDAWVLRPLDFEQPDRLMALHELQPLRGDRGSSVAPANLRDWQAQSRSFEAIVPFSRESYNFQGEDDPERVAGARVAAELFPLLGVDPDQGRHFLPEEDLPNGPAVALISHTSWQRRFNSDPKILGRTLRLDGELHEVVGVMPPGFEFPEWAHVWTPLGLDPDAEEHHRRWLSVVARLEPGVGFEQAQAELKGIAQRLEELHPETNAGWSAEIVPLREEWSPPIIRRALSVSVAVAACVLLVICANVASLMLAQATGRRREVALRAALGAGRGRLIRQTITESLVLALAGGALGSVIGIWWVDWMKSWAPVEIPYLFRYQVDGRALVYTLAISLVTGVVCALAPVFRGAGFDIAETLKNGGGRSAGSRRSRLRGSLVVAEFAVSVVLVVGAMLMVKSFLHEQLIEPGYRTRGILTMRLSFTGTGYRESDQRVAFLEQALERIAGLGEVESAAAADHLPVSNSGFTAAEIEVEGRRQRPGERPMSAVHSVTRDYFETLDIDLVEGRSFTAGEAREGGEVALISHALANRLWPEGGALERRIRFHGDQAAPWLRIVGVVGDVDPGHSMVNDSWPGTQVYVPYGSSSSAMVTLAIRSATDTALLATAVRRELRRLDPGAPVSGVQTIAQAIDEVHWVSRLFTQLFSLYAAIALAIAALGIYAVTADSVSRRIREMGVRMSLGARPADLLWLVARRTWILGAVGVALGLIGAYPLTGVMSSMLYQVRTDDPSVFAGVALLLASVALLAAVVPARRAMKVSPMEVLRFE